MGGAADLTDCGDGSVLLAWTNSLEKSFFNSISSILFLGILLSFFFSFFSLS